MRLYRAKSVLSLILTGFGLVAVPVIVVLVSAAIYVDRLAVQSQKTVFDAVQAIQDRRMLVEQITTLERSARQFQVLGDPALFQVYERTHEVFQARARQLASGSSSNAERAVLDRLISGERSIFQVLRDQPPDSQAGEHAVAGFVGLTELADSVLSGTSRMVDEEVEVMRVMVDRIQQIFLWQAVLLIPATIVLAAMFTVLIARPIRQIDNAIRHLGTEDFSQAIGVRGPKDLEILGQRLEWLRLRLIALEEEKNKFLRHISHELKTPLAAIREGSNLLTQGIVGDLNREQHDIATILHTNTLHLQKRIEDLLNFSAALRRDAVLVRAPVRLHRLIKSVIADHRPMMLARSIRLEATLPAVTVPGDADKLRSVFDNLLSNAVKYSPPGGTIRLRLATEGDRAVFQIQDDGPGIHPGDRGRVFDPFFQGRHTAEGHIQGTGLGLSIARECVAAHGGTVTLGDIARGTVFTVRLPRSQEGS